LISTDEAPIKLVELLVKKGAQLNTQNDTGGTALHLATFWGHFDLVKLLVNEGARMDVKNDKGRTPLDLAGNFGHKTIAKFLSEKSGQPMPEMKSKERKTKQMEPPGEPPTPDKFKS
jgi:ankyrin repeat protein